MFRHVLLLEQRQQLRATAPSLPWPAIDRQLIAVFGKAPDRRQSAGESRRHSTSARTSAARINAVPSDSATFFHLIPVAGGVREANQRQDSPKDTRPDPLTTLCGHPSRPAGVTCDGAAGASHHPTEWTPQLIGRGLPGRPAGFQSGQCTAAKRSPAGLTSSVLSPA